MLKRGRPVWFLLFFLLGAMIILCADNQRFLVVLKPVADLRSIPKDGKMDYQHDDARETQVLYNEVLVYKGENADWYQVEALEQREFSHHKSWQGYPGWIRKENVCFVDEAPEYNSVVNSPVTEVFSAPSSSSAALFAVSAGTKFNEIGCSADFCKVSLPGKAFGWIVKNKITKIDETLSESALRENILRTARLFLKTPYLWGGRSGSAVDCSGLTNLAYRASGIDIPRDAHEQWMLSKPITQDQLKPADLIFLSKEDAPKTIVHVMLFLGNGDFIEAPGTGKTVRISHFKDYDTSGKKMYFGRLLP